MHPPCGTVIETFIICQYQLNFLCAFNFTFSSYSMRNQEMIWNFKSIRSILNDAQPLKTHAFTEMRHITGNQIPGSAHLFIFFIFIIEHIQYSLSFSCIKKWVQRGSCPLQLSSSVKRKHKPILICLSLFLYSFGEAVQGVTSSCQQYIDFPWHPVRRMCGQNHRW